MNYKGFVSVVLLTVVSNKIAIAADGDVITINSNTTTRQTISDNNVTLINNAILSLSGARVITISGTPSGTTITNNAGASITATDQPIRCLAACTNITINNFGRINTTTTGSSGIIRLTSATGATVNNNPGGVIQGIGNEDDGHHAVDLGTSGTLINRGTIIRTKDGAPGLENVTSAIAIQGNNGTVLLKDDSILVGLINNFLNFPGAKL